MRRQKISFDRIEKWARKNPILVILSVTIVISSSIVSLIDGGARLKEIYTDTLGDNSANYAKIQSLATGTQIDYFSAVLGAPAFKNHEQTNYFEYVFVHPKYYVQAITDTENNVLLYSVTTRVSGFNPTFGIGGIDSRSGKEFTVVLGKTKFDQLPFNPKKLEGDQGARRSYYREKYYFGNLGFYQNYDFAYSDSGYPQCEEVVPYDIIPKEESVYGIDMGKLPPELKRFRSVCVINTFSVSSFAADPKDDVDNQIYDIGADYDQVRVLK